MAKLNDAYASDDWSAERQASYDRLNLRHAQLTREVTHLEAKLSLIDASSAKRGAKREPSMLERFIRSGVSGLSQHERENSLDDAVLDFSPRGGGPVLVIENAATASDGSGAALTQETVRPSVVSALKSYGGANRLAYHMSTDTGSGFRVPQHDDTGSDGIQLNGQGADIGTDDMEDFGFIELDARTVSSRAINITREMLADSIIDIEGYAGAIATRRMGRRWDKAFTTDGTIPGEVNGAPANTKPAYPTDIIGVQKSAAAGVTTAGSNKIIYDDIVNLIYSVPAAYRNAGESGEFGFMAESGGVTGFLISDDCERYVRLMKDGDGRPLWQAKDLGIGASGMSGELLGYPYEVSYSMAGKVATDNAEDVMLFGNFSYYGIRTIDRVEIFRFQDSATMSKNTIQILALSRRYGRPMVAGIGVQGSANNKTVWGGVEQFRKLKIKA